MILYHSKCNPFFSKFHISVGQYFAALFKIHPDPLVPHMYTFFAEDRSEVWRMSRRACETWLETEREAQISKPWLQHQAWWRHSVRLRSAWGMSSKSLLSKHFCIAPFLGHINCRCVCSISFLSFVLFLFSPSFSWSNGNNPHLSTKTVSLQENVETGCGLQHVCWEAEWF